MEFPWFGDNCQHSVDQCSKRHCGKATEIKAEALLVLCIISGARVHGALKDLGMIPQTAIMVME